MNKVLVEMPEVMQWIVFDLWAMVSLAGIMFLYFCYKDNGAFKMVKKERWRWPTAAALIAIGFTIYLGYLLFIRG